MVLKNKKNFSLIDMKLNFVIYALTMSVINYYGLQYY